MRYFLISTLVAVALAGPAASQTTSRHAAVTTNAIRVDGALILPPPPKVGSTDARREVAELHLIEHNRTAAELVHAKADAKTKNVTIFAGVMGAGFDLAHLPATKALFDMVRAEEKAAADQAKHFFRRPRPWIVDPALHSCSREDGPDTSYPSGHSTMGFTMAEILARLAPNKAQAILARAADYAHSRLVCEMHFRSDIVAGQAFGTLLAERMMEQPKFRAKFDAAEGELRSAKLL